MALLPTLESAIANTGSDLLTAISLIISVFVVFWGIQKLGEKMGWIDSDVRSGISAGYRYEEIDKDGKSVTRYWSSEDEYQYKRNRS